MELHSTVYSTFFLNKDRKSNKLNKNLTEQDHLPVMVVTARQLCVTLGD